MVCPQPVNACQKNPILLILVFVFLGFIIQGCAGVHHKPFAENPEPQRRLSAYEIRLQKAALSSRQLSIEEIGQVHYPGFQAPLWRISFQPDQPAAYKVFINAAIHGSEPAGAEYAVRLVERLAKSPQQYTKTAFDIIPIVNPWGWVHNIRFNRDGTDINRDFATFKSQEARIIKKTLQDVTYHLMLDLHEDPSADGFYLYQYGLADKTASKKIVATVANKGYPIEQNVNMVILKTDNGIIDAPMLGLWYVRLTGQMSIANYYRLNNSKYVFTVESPIRLLWEDRLIMQRTAVDTFVDYFTK